MHIQDEIKFNNISKCKEMRKKSDIQGNEF